MPKETIKTFKSWVKESNHIVFFGGAGVSTESGIPDFRSVDGLYHTKYSVPPEVILSHSFFMDKPREFYNFYRDKMVYIDAKPNITHTALTRLEDQGKLKGIITQNIDGLHQKAGSRKVYELHGSVYRNYCMKCGRFYPLEMVLTAEAIPCCDCGGIIKPDVVLYEEGLDQEVLSASASLLSQAELLIIGGTSLSVYPAAGLVRYYRGNRMVLINKSVTPYDKDAALLIQAGLGEVFSEILEI